MSSLNGVLPVDKPIGPTSHDAVALARRALRTRRIGHTGTLDPFASGLLLLCIGRATRLSEYLVGLPKSYTATMRLGQATATDDLEGDVIRSDEGWRDLSREAVERAFARQTGELMQVPPRYSAKKISGVRAYDVARQGGAVEVRAVKVTVFRLDIIRLAPPEVDFYVECSSGTYIRAIARDVGDDLGVGAHLTVLRRMSIGDYSVEDAAPLSGVVDPETVEPALVSPLDALHHLPKVLVDDEEAGIVARGGSIFVEEVFPGGGPVAVATSGGALLAIAEVRDHTLRPRKVFA